MVVAQQKTALSFFSTPRLRTAARTTPINITAWLTTSLPSPERLFPWKAVSSSKADRTSGASARRKSRTPATSTPGSSSSRANMRSNQMLLFRHWFVGQDPFPLFRRYKFLVSAFWFFGDCQFYEPCRNKRFLLEPDSTPTDCPARESCKYIGP